MLYGGSKEAAASVVSLYLEGCFKTLFYMAIRECIFQKRKMAIKSKYMSTSGDHFLNLYRDRVGVDLFS